MISSFSVGSFGCNYDSPKVAKFLVALFATCISCLTIGYLSCGLFSLVFGFDVKIRGMVLGQKDPVKLYCCCSTCSFCGLLCLRVFVNVLICGV